VDRFTRKELKTDRFAAEVGHTMEFLGRHRRQATLIGGIALGILLVGVGTYFYQQRQHLVRQRELRTALRTHQAGVGPGGSPFLVSFETQQEKDEAVDRHFHDLVSNYPGSDEAIIATYYLGVVVSDKGRPEEAEKYLKQVVESDNEAYASQAALALAGVYQGQGRTEEAEKLLRKLMENPTILVSKEQATLALARLVAPDKPKEARELLEPLRTERGAVSRAALTALGEFAQQ